MLNVIYFSKVNVNQYQSRASSNNISYRLFQQKPLLSYLRYPCFLMCIQIQVCSRVSCKAAASQWITRSVFSLFLFVCLFVYFFFADPRGLFLIPEFTQILVLHHFKCSLFVERSRHSFDMQKDAGSTIKVMRASLLRISEVTKL